MVTLTGTVRPPSIWKLKEFTELYSGVHNLRLCPEDRRLLVRALTNVLLLHWPGLNEQVYLQQILSKNVKIIHYSGKSRNLALFIE